MSGIFWSNQAVIRTLTLSLAVVWVGCAVTAMRGKRRHHPLHRALPPRWSGLFRPTLPA